MKRIILFISLCGMMMCLNAQSKKTTTIDLEVEKAAINAMLDKFETVTQTDTLVSFLTENVLVAGTAPKELWTKREYVEIMNSLWNSGIIPEFTYTSDRILKLAADGNSATALREYTMPFMSSTLAARNTAYLVKIDGKWMIDFLNIAFVPKNEDIPKIDNVLSE